MKKSAFRLLSSLLALCLALALLPGTALAVDVSALISDDCGDNLTWSYGNGVLTIRGRGPIYDYGELQAGGYASYPKPWVDYEGQIHTVNIENGVTGIGSAAFSQFFFLDSVLTSVTIPSSVTYIGEYAFHHCIKLTDVVIPSSVTSIGENAFDGCSSLKSVVIPNGVTVIEDETFIECTGLTSVTIPASVTRIADSAFTSSYNLKDVYYGGSESQWKQITIVPTEFGNNDELLAATIHYNGAGDAPSTEPAPTTPDGIAVTVGGDAVVWTDAAPFIDENNRTLVPLRVVASAMGLEVVWDPAAREASFTDGSKTIWFPIGSIDARTSDGGTLTMDTAAVIANDRTYAPIRYLAQYFGYEVDWDAASRTVIIK